MKFIRNMAILGIIIAIALNINPIIKNVLPYKYSDYITRYSQVYNVDPILVSAVIKAESNFDPDAVSSKEAYGLMQITPETAHWAAQKMGIDDFSTDMLAVPETNIMIGCWYLHNLFDEFNNQELALAAYNAGRGNVQKWLNNPEYSDDGITLKKIPFKETESYVKRVGLYYKLYEFLYY
ncbi:MAG: lytic transglycosylase domain-containing protein [Clostridiaceae bacterium]